MEFTAKWEVSYTPNRKNRKADSQTWEGTDVVESESEERAREYMEHVLEERYPGENGYTLLALEIVPA